MGTANVLPPPLDTASNQGHSLELWILVNGSIIQATGTFLTSDLEGRPRVSADLPDDFVGVVRNGSAVRGFFTDHHGQVHTFLTSIRSWQAFQDRPSSAQVVLEPPTAVAPCQRRRGVREPTQNLSVELGVTIRGERTVVEGQLVDASPTGLGVRVVRSARNWFAEGTVIEARIGLPTQPDPVSLRVTVARVEKQALNFLYGLRVNNALERKALGDILEHLLAPR